MSVLPITIPIIVSAHYYRAVVKASIYGQVKHVSSESQEEMTESSKNQGNIKWSLPV